MSLPRRLFTLLSVVGVLAAAGTITWPSVLRDSCGLIDEATIHLRTIDKLASCSSITMFPSASSTSNSRVNGIRGQSSCIVISRHHSCLSTSQGHAEARMIHHGQYRRQRQREGSQLRDPPVSAWPHELVLTITPNLGNINRLFQGHFSSRDLQFRTACISLGC